MIKISTNIFVKAKYNLIYSIRVTIQFYRKMHVPEKKNNNRILTSLEDNFIFLGKKRGAKENGKRKKENTHKI